MPEQNYIPRLPDVGRSTGSDRKNYASPALEAAKLVVAGRGHALRVAAFNNNAATRYLMVFDTSVAPVNGDVPIATRAIPATEEDAIDLPGGLQFERGLAVANSSTLATLTIGAADQVFNVLYRTS